VLDNGLIVALALALLEELLAMAMDHPIGRRLGTLLWNSSRILSSSSRAGRMDVYEEAIFGSMVQHPHNLE
jgi:hypothetical protein